MVSPVRSSPRERGKRCLPGVPANLDELAEWLGAGMHLRERGDVVHLMMLDRAAGSMVGSISVFQESRLLAG